MENKKTLVSINFQGERIWEADVAFPGRRFFSESLPSHQVLGWGDKVIVVSLNRAVKAFALKDGRLLWSTPGEELKKDDLHPSNEELIPLPVVYKNCLHIAGERNIRRFSMEDGKELKPFEFLEDEKGQVSFTSPLAASDSTLFFCAMIEKPETSQCYAINLDSGELSWKQKRGAYHDRLLVEDRQVIVIGRRVSASEPEDRGHHGKPIACYDVTTGLEVPMQDIKSALDVGRPLHQGALFTSHGRELAKVHIRKGKILWVYRGKKNMEPAIAMGGGVIYAQESSTPYRLHAISESDGNPLWICDEEPGQFTRKLLIPSNGALFSLANRGLEVLGTPVETHPGSEKDGGMPTDQAAIRKEIEDIDRQIGELRNEWDECKRLLEETAAKGDATEEAKRLTAVATRRFREIAEAVPTLKARRVELEKRIK